MSDPTNESHHVSLFGRARTWSGATKTRLVIWIVGGTFGIYLIVTGIVGILTKAR